MRLTSGLFGFSVNRNGVANQQQEPIRFGKAGTFIEKIVTGQSREKMIFENRHAAVIPNIDPSRPGQVLVVSKRSVDLLKELSKAERNDVFRLVVKYQQFWEALKRNRGKTFAYSIFINDGLSAGQSVPHFHVQLIPIETTKPLREGLFRFAIDPYKKGLPKNAAERDERINRVYNPFHAITSEIQKFATQEGLKTSFTATA